MYLPRQESSVTLRLKRANVVRWLVKIWLLCGVTAVEIVR
jgi:hypothetical protein